MAEQPKEVVNETVSDTSVVPTTTETQQTTTVKEDVKTEVVDQEKENIKRALQEERERRKAVEARNRELEQAHVNPQPVVAPVAPVADDQDEIAQRFIRTESLTELNFLINKDPFVKENLDLIEDEMRASRVGAREAIKNVKEAVLDRILRGEAPAQTTTTVPNQIKPTATPEETEPEIKGSYYQAAKEGKIKGVDPDLLRALSEA